MSWTTIEVRNEHGRSEGFWYEPNDVYLGRMNRAWRDALTSVLQQPRTREHWAPLSFDMKWAEAVEVAARQTLGISLTSFDQTRALIFCEALSAMMRTERPPERKEARGGE